MNACSTAPDLKRLYAHSVTQTNQPPVIIIPGLMGSKLRDKTSHEEVWVGSLSKVLFSDYTHLALKINPETLEPEAPGLEAFAITDTAAGNDFYASILNTLEDAGGYTAAKPGTPAGPGTRNYYVFPYDWRQDNIITVRKLDRFIHQIREDYNQPDLKVDVIAHSMGGLITRYYLRYGTMDVLGDNNFPVTMGGANYIRRVILLGTPNLGSIEAINSFITGQEVVFGSIPPEILISMPSIYQLFPHAINDWIITTRGEALTRDQFDVEIWKRFEWAIFDPKVQSRIRNNYTDPQLAQVKINALGKYFKKYLERGRRFSWALTVPVKKPKPLIVFGGDCHLTPARIVVEEISGVSMVRQWPYQIKNPVKGINYEMLMLEPGDGTVTKASLLARNVLDPAVPRHKYSYFPLDYSFFLCERHDKLTGNVSFQDNLLHALFSQDKRISPQ